jgi:hypothetical protein
MTMLVTEYFSCLDALCAPSSSSEIIDGFCGAGIYNADHSIYMDHEDDDENELKRHHQNPTDHNATVVKSRIVQKPPKSKAMVQGEVKMDDDDLDKMLEDMGKQRYRYIHLLTTHTSLLPEILLPNYGR